MKSRKIRPGAEVETSPPEGSRPRHSRQNLLHIFLGLSISITVIGLTSAWWLARSTGDLYSLEIFLHQFIVHETPGSLLTIAVLLFAILLAARDSQGRIERVVAFFADRPWTVAGATFGFLVFGSLFVYHKHPLAMDEYMPLFQAKVFAAGEIYGQFPTPMIRRLIPPDFLNQAFVFASLASGKVISTYSPGFALMLAPFAKLGVPWLLNPLLGAGALLLIGYLARRLLGDPMAAGWAMLLTLASPAFTVNAISYYSLTAHLFLNLLFVALLLTRSSRNALAAGGAGSLALTLSNPVPHALFALPWLVWMIATRQWKNFTLLVLGYLPLSLILGIGWLQVRASVLAENVSRASAPIGEIAPEKGVAESAFDEIQVFLSILEVPEADFLFLRDLAFLKLLFWAVPGLPILAAIGYSKLRNETPIQLLAVSGLVTFLFSLFVRFDQGHGWGYRYFHSAWGTLPLLAAAALSRPLSDSRRLRRLVATAALLSLLAGNGLRFGQVHQFIERHLAQVATAPGDQPQVRFIDLDSGFYVVDLIQNDPFLEAPVWTLISHGPRRDAAMMRSAFPGSRLAVDLGNSTAWIIE